MKRPLRRWAALAAALILSSLLVSDAVATFPGTNGRIAFVSDGNLYVIQADGSGATLVAPCDTGRISHPVWSPDATRLAYSSGGSIFTVAPDGSGRAQVATGTWPSWSPDGTSIVFEMGQAIAIVNADGTGLRTVTDGYQPTWTPDGQLIVFGRSTDLGDNLYSIAVGGTGETQLTNAGGQFRDEAPSVSPDGRSILFQRADFTIVDANDNVSQDLFIMSISGSSPRQLTQTPEQESNPAWAPDGTAIVFSSGFTEPPGTDLYRALPDGSQRVLLADLGTEDVTPDWGVVGPSGIRARADDGDRTGAWLERFPVMVRSRLVRAVAQQAPQCGSGSKDVIQGTDGPDVIFAGPGNDSVSGGGGDDIIVGEGGDDRLLGGGGDDLLFGDSQEEDRDPTFLRAAWAATTDGNDVLNGGGGNDLTFGGGGKDLTLGKAGRDKLYGGPGSDTTKGGGGNDKLYGQPGADLLNGGPGRDQMIAGAGHDTCVLDTRRDITDSCEKERRHYRRHY